MATIFGKISELARKVVGRGKESVGKVAEQSKLRSAWNWLRGNRVQPPPPPSTPTQQPGGLHPSTETGGERGFAIGLGTELDKTTVPGRILNRQRLLLADVQDFVYDGGILICHSSNVGAAQYFPEEKKMMVEFHGGTSKTSAYLYSDISEREALSFAQAQSKGGWCWSHLRVRGSATAHQKPYVRIR